MPKNIFTFLLGLLILSSCIEKVGYYDAGQESIIEKLTDKKWERDHHAKLDNGEEFDVHEICFFSKNGNGSYKSITTYKTGEEKEKITYFKWTFTTPDFSVIYMDYPRYWTIDKLNENKLCIYQTYEDPISISGQERFYKEYLYKE